MNNKYGDFEQSILDKNAIGIKNVQNRLGLDELISTYKVVEEPHAPEILSGGDGMGKPMVRVLENGVSKEKVSEDYDVPLNLLQNQGNGGETNSINPFNPSGSSFILAFAGVLLLIFVISIVTFSVLKYLNV